MNININIYLQQDEDTILLQLKFRDLPLYSDLNLVIRVYLIIFFTRLTCTIYW